LDSCRKQAQRWSQTVKVLQLCTSPVLLYKPQKSRSSHEHLKVSLVQLMPCTNPRPGGIALQTAEVTLYKPQK